MAIRLSQRQLRSIIKEVAQGQSPVVDLVLGLLLEDPARWDLADALDDSELALLANATDQDVEQIVNVIRSKIMKGIDDAREMVG